MSESLQLLTSCDAPGCLGLSTQMLDRFGALPLGLPDGWTALPDGKTMCPRHKIDAVWYVDGKVLDV